MKKLLKFICLALTFILVLATFSACGQTPPPDNGGGGNQGGGTEQGGGNQGGNQGGEQGGGNQGGNQGGEQGGGNQGGETAVYYGTDDMWLMSFNIRQTDQWSKRQGAFMDYLNTGDATVVCMQEVKKAQVADIQNGTSKRFNFVYYAREGGSNPEGLGILYDKHVWNLLSQDMFWLSETPNEMSYGWGASYYRICVNLLLENRQTGAKLDVYNVHLDHQVELARVNGMDLVLSRVAKSQYPCFVTGDMNCTSTTPAIVAAATAMQNCQAVAPITEEGAIYQGWGSVADDGATAIDFCFVSKKDMQPLVFDICQDKWGDNNYYSDHYAVKTKVRMTYKALYPPVSEDGFDGAIEQI